MKTEKQLAYLSLLSFILMIISIIFISKYVAMGLQIIERTR